MYTATAVAVEGFSGFNLALSPVTKQIWKLDKTKEKQAKVPNEMRTHSMEIKIRTDTISLSCIKRQSCGTLTRKAAESIAANSVVTQTTELCTLVNICQVNKVLYSFITSFFS